MTLILLSFLSGILTVLAPCAFMLLPIIIGGSAGQASKARPYIITASLAISLFLFTVLLKATSLFINVNPIYINYFSGVVIIFLGLISLFPEIWDKAQIKLGLSKKSDELLEKAESQKGIIGAIFTGAALGPVFSSCSPTFVFVLTTVIRENVFTAFLNVIAYIIGLSIVMLLVSIFGQAFTRRTKWAANPKGLFKRVISIIFIIVGLAIVTGQDVRLKQAYQQLPFLANFEASLLTKSTGGTTNDKGEILNVATPYPAPEIAGIDQWINSDGEKISDLKGKVVLVEFWTYSCINCVRSGPYLNQLYNTYKDDGFTILGLHAPEFSFEKNKGNVQKAINEKYGYKFPVGLDNDYETWDAYNNKFWPSLYLIDAQGNIRYTHSGEGDYNRTESAVQLLLQEAGKDVSSTIMSDKVQTKGVVLDGVTPETYLGWSRSDLFSNKSELKANETTTYSKNNSPAQDYWTLGGDWNIKKDTIECISNCELTLNFRSKNVYIVATLSASTGTNNTIELSLDGNPLNATNAGVDVSASKITIDRDGLFELVSLDGLKSGQILTLKPKSGVILNVFTFGG